MKISPTELMKKLKYISQEILNVYSDDGDNAFVPMDKNEDGVLTPMYETTYDFRRNRNRIKELHEEEIKIKNLLNEFNQNNNVDGYPFNVNEGLIRLAQLKKEISTLTNMNKSGLYVRDRYGDNIRKGVFELNEVKEELRKAQSELSKLQVAIDKTNLMSQIEYNN